MNKLNTVRASNVKADFPEVEEIVDLLRLLPMILVF